MNQLGLWSDVSSTSQVPTEPLHVPPLSEREIIFDLGRRHGFPEFLFSMGTGQLGDCRSGIILAGEAHWKLVLDHEPVDPLWLSKAAEAVRGAAS